MCTFLSVSSKVTFVFHSVSTWDQKECLLQIYGFAFFRRLSKRQICGAGNRSGETTSSTWSQSEFLPVRKSASEMWKKYCDTISAAAASLRASTVRSSPVRSWTPSRDSHSSGSGSFVSCTLPLQTPFTRESLDINPKKGAVIPADGLLTKGRKGRSLV